MVGICDANNFYISCERVFNPALNGRPAVVLSNNDRCIIARSNEAKAIGLKMGQPIYQVRDTLRTYNVALCSPNFVLLDFSTFFNGDIQEDFKSAVSGYVRPDAGNTETVRPDNRLFD